MTTSDDLEVFANAQELSDAVANRFVNGAIAAIESRGEFIVALSGGSTPRPVYASLASEPFVSRLDWSRIKFVWCDERCVPPDHESSNFRMVRESLLDHVDVADSNVHRMRGEDDPKEAARNYEQVLRTIMRTPSGPPRTVPGKRFDLVLLGLGSDGHTASLFPRAASLEAGDRWVAAEYVHAVSMWRLTLTATLINSAAHVAFMVSGSTKAGIVQQVLERPTRSPQLPAQLINPTDGHLHWMIDLQAAAGLAHI